MTKASAYAVRTRSRQLISAFVVGMFAAVAVYGMYALSKDPPLSQVPVFLLWSGVFLLTWRYRLRLRRLPPTVIFAIVAVEVVSLTNGGITDFTRRKEVRTYDALVTAIRANDLRAARKILETDDNPDFLPNVSPLFILNGPCRYEKRQRPIDIAISQGNVPIAEMLVSRGVALLPEDGDGLEAAALRGDLPTVRFLVSQGVLPNARDGKSVALWNAVSANQPEIVSLLLDAGASPDSWGSMSNNGESVSALSLAKDRNAREIVLLLRRAGATE